MSEILIEWERYRRKDGTPGRLIEGVTHYSPLFVCELCEKLGPKKKIQYRNDCYLYEHRDRYRSGTPLLCMGCWNKIRPLVKRIREAQENDKLIRKMKRELRELERERNN